MLLLYVSTFTVYNSGLRSVFLSILLCTTSAVSGQTLYGVVVNGETAKPLHPVTITNTLTQQYTVADSQGNYSINAQYGDIITFTCNGFNTARKQATPGTYLLVELFQLNVKLPDYVLHPSYTPFQKDSAEMAETYSKELNTQKVKPGFSSANGGGVSGLIGSAVQKVSKSYKQNKRFKENFRKDIEQKYIDTRYKPSLVSSLTGFTGDTLAVFMNTYPMEYDFARTASDLELKMWIRDNLKDYLHKKDH